QDVDYIVTEFGIAHLKGKSVRDRVLSLVNIAHPNFKDFLLNEAKKLNLI
ncbi:MAG: 4-hydroxybutyrate--acetyl-CoA CoA transferase, partial [Caldiserica bacterium]|nr:4-hydroxybutyrate--acetyl-CoA CoA transferase [Caldisericota bacterium]